jgi:hypothetical protein
MRKHSFLRLLCRPLLCLRIRSFWASERLKVSWHLLETCYRLCLCIRLSPRPHPRQRSPQQHLPAPRPRASGGLSVRSPPTLCAKESLIFSSPVLVSSGRTAAVASVVKSTGMLMNPPPENWPSSSSLAVAAISMRPRRSWTFGYTTGSGCTPCCHRSRPAALCSLSAYRLRGNRVWTISSLRAACHRSRAAYLSTLLP